MNATEPLTDDLIQAAFERRADRADRYDLSALGAEITAATGTARQVGRWSLRLGGARSTIAPRPVLVAIAVLAALLGLAIALVLIGQRPSTPFRTGLLAYIRDGDVYLANPDASNPRLVLHEDGTTFVTVAWSRDGSHLAADGESGAIVVDAATAAATRIGGTNPVWSPDGRELAVLEPSTTSSAAVGSEIRVVEVASAATSHVYPFPAVGGLAWSPDGRWIAGTGGTSGESNALAVLDLTTGAWSELDGASGMLDSEREPAWSPDSSHIAFIRWGPATCHGDPLCSTDIYVAKTDGSAAVRLNGVQGKADQPTWSPDGQWIAYRSVDRAEVAVGNGGSIVDTGSAIVIVHPDGTGERTFAAKDVHSFEWGAGSDRLRYVTTAGTGSTPTLWEAPLDGVARQLDVPFGSPPDGFERTGTIFGWQPVAVGQAVPPLPSVPPRAPTASMSVVAPASASPADPSGSWPTLAATSVDGCQPMTISTATGATTTLATLCDDSFHVDTWAWSPAVSVFAAVRGGTLAIVGRDGRVTMDVAHLTGLDSLDWSPDGTWLMATTGARTWLLRPDGSGLREIPGTATWSGDGRTLGVARADGQLLVGGADGSDLKAIGEFPGVVSWSPDGSRFAFIRDGDAWTASRDGTDQRNVTALPIGGASSVAWSGDGRWIAVGATHGFWLAPTDGGEKRWFDLGLGETLYDVHWAAAGASLAVETYTNALGAQRNFVYLVDPGGSPTVRLDDLTTPSWSPDGRFLAGARSDVGSDTRTLVLMHADGSGRHEFPGVAGLDPLVWVRP